MLRQDDDELALAPQPSLSRIDDLVESLRAAGLPVELRIDGEPVELPPGVDVSAFRIIQEALTNALKHESARPVTGSRQQTAPPSFDRMSCSWTCGCRCSTESRVLAGSRHSRRRHG